MPIQDKPAKTVNRKPAGRRRKKRRTEDFSSSSESSSSSSSDNDSDEEKIQDKDNTEAVASQSLDHDMDIDINSDVEEDKKENTKVPDNLSIEQKKQLDAIPFTTTSVSRVTNTNTASALKTLPNVAETSRSIDFTKQELNSKFLKLMTKEFGNDLDELRQKPDFNGKSLATLAKVLQSGVNMFDFDTVQALVEEESKLTN